MGNSYTEYLKAAKHFKDIVLLDIITYDDILKSGCLILNEMINKENQNNPYVIVQLNNMYAKLTHKNDKIIIGFLDELSYQMFIKINDLK